VIFIVLLKNEQLFDHLAQVLDSLTKVDLGWIHAEQLNGADGGSDGHLFGLVVEEDFYHHIVIL